MSINDRAKIIHNVFKQHGFSDVASAGAIGNLEHESNLQPNVTEVGGYGGYGLAQWTPKENLYTQGSILGFSRAQCEQLEVQAEIIAKATTVGQWTNAMSSNYDVAERISPLTFNEYKAMTNLRSATVNFMGHYLRPTYLSKDNKIYEERIPHAEKWFNFLTNGSIPDPDPDPDPDPEPEPPKIDFSQINQFFDQFAENTQNKIIEFINKTLYDYGTSQFFGNNYLRVNENLPKTYQITVSKKFKNDFNDLFVKGKDELEKIIGNIEVPIPDPDPDPDPDPEPSKDKYFPVDKNANGINFWYPPHNSDLEKNMDWGYRTSGVWHAGYDIGGGNGGNHNIYAVRSGKVIDVRYQNLSGYLIIIEHDDDEYYTLYQHLLEGSTIVKIGDKVRGGQQIAKMGSSGGNYAVHLHLELATSPNDFWTTRTIDPKPYLGITADNTTSLKNPV